MACAIQRNDLHKPQTIKLAIGWIKHRTVEFTPSGKSKRRGINIICEIINNNADIM